MVTIVQCCPAPDCEGDVRYSTVALVGGSGPEGSCDRCRRVYRLNPGRAPTEIDRIDVTDSKAVRPEPTAARSAAIDDIVA
jgi:hypothetical protein